MTLALRLTSGESSPVALASKATAFTGIVTNGEPKPGRLSTATAAGKATLARSSAVAVRVRPTTSASGLGAVAIEVVIARMGAPAKGAVRRGRLAVPRRPTRATAPAYAAAASVIATAVVASPTA